MPQELKNGRAAKRPRPLKAEQMWRKVLQPLGKLKDRLKVINDPALSPIVTELEAMERVLWKKRAERELAEATAADKGEISWILFEPRGPTIFDVGRVITRTPRTIYVKNEYWTIPDRVVVCRPETVWEDLDKRLHDRPLDLAKFQEHSRKVDESYRKYLAKGGPEAEQAMA